MASARDAILRRGRRGAGVAARSRRAWWRSSFAKAAGLILAFAAAGSAALPGSPLRVWLGELVDREESPEGAAADLVEPPVQPDEAAPPPEVGVHLVESAGRVRISVVGLSPGGEVLVELVDGQSSGVFAAEGARFQTGPGQVEAEVPGSWVRIELARSLGSADVEVDGALYLRKTGERLQLLGPDRDSTDAQIRFRLPSEGS